MLSVCARGGGQPSPCPAEGDGQGLEENEPAGPTNERRAELSLFSGRR